MNKIMEKYDYKITYGKSSKRLSGAIENWIGIITNYNNGDSGFGYKIGYLEKDNSIIINEVKKESREIDSPLLYFVFPLIKLIEKAKKKKINEVLVSAATRNVDKALRPFFDVNTEGEKRKFILNEERLLMVVELIKIISYHPVVWEVKHINSNIIFRTKTGYFYLCWDEMESGFSLRKNDDKDIWKDEQIMQINNELDLHQYLQRLELVETFQPLLIEKTKRMYLRLTGKSIDDVSNDELKCFYQDIEQHLSLENIEKQLKDKKMLEKCIYLRKTLKYYDFEHFIVGMIQTSHSGKKFIIEDKSKYQQVIYYHLNVDLKTEVEQLII